MKEFEREITKIIKELRRVRFLTWLRLVTHIIALPFYFLGKSFNILGLFMMWYPKTAKRELKKFWLIRYIDRRDYNNIIED